MRIDEQFNGGIIKSVELEGAVLSGHEDAVERYAARLQSEPPKLATTTRVMALINEAYWHLRDGVYQTAWATPSDVLKDLHDEIQSRMEAIDAEPADLLAAVDELACAAVQYGTSLPSEIFDKVDELKRLIRERGVKLDPPNMDAAALLLKFWKSIGTFVIGTTCVEDGPVPYEVTIARWLKEHDIPLAPKSGFSLEQLEQIEEAFSRIMREQYKESCSWESALGLLLEELQKLEVKEPEPMPKLDPPNMDAKKLLEKYEKRWLDVLSSKRPQSEDAMNLRVGLFLAEHAIPLAPKSGYSLEQIEGELKKESEQQKHNYRTHPAAVNAIADLVYYFLKHLKQLEVKEPAPTNER